MQRQRGLGVPPARLATNSAFAFALHQAAERRAHGRQTQPTFDLRSRQDHRRYCSRRVNPRIAPSGSRQDFNCGWLVSSRPFEQRPPRRSDPGVVVPAVRCCNRLTVLPTAKIPRNDSVRRASDRRGHLPWSDGARPNPGGSRSRGPHQSPGNAGRTYWFKTVAPTSCGPPYAPREGAVPRARAHRRWQTVPTRRRQYRGDRTASPLPAHRAVCPWSF